MEGKNCIEVYPKGTQRTEEVQPMVTASSVEILQSQDGMVLSNTIIKRFNFKERSSIVLNHEPTLEMIPTPFVRCNLSFYKAAREVLFDPKQPVNSHAIV